MKALLKSKPLVVCSGGRGSAVLLPLAIAAGVGFTLVGLAQPPEVTGVDYKGRAGMEPPVMGMEVAAPPMSCLTVMHNPQSGIPVDAICTARGRP